jgi:hypothetical protein
MFVQPGVHTILPGSSAGCSKPEHKSRHSGGVRSVLFWWRHAAAKLRVWLPQGLFPNLPAGPAVQAHLGKPFMQCK